MGIKNIWSLNVDELLVADKIKDVVNKKYYEVFFPLNSQMKDIDLLLVNLKNNKSKAIQVKGSRTYEPRKSQVEAYGEGSGAWFRINKKAIFKTTNKIDFFVFVLHSFVDSATRKIIKIDYLIIPIVNFKKICAKKKVYKGGLYHFYIWIDSKGKRSFEFRDKTIMLSKYLNNWSLLNK